jgi:hypothetical protein
MVRARRRGRKAGSLLVLSLAAGALVWTAFSVVAANPLPDTSTCTIPQTAVVWPYWAVYVGAGVVSFVAGHFLVRLRDFPRHEPDYEPLAARLSLVGEEERLADHRHRRRVWTIQLLLAVCLTLVTVLLGYETWAELASPPRSAVTDFVRCASNVAWPQTLVASCTILFLAGHWLWHPARRHHT